MQSSTFPWMNDLNDLEAYEFLEGLIELAQTAGSPTGFLRALDEHVSTWSVTAEATSVTREAAG
ncbi:hypothetical protein OG210_21765 [Streptomyces sp. NBC_00466]|uniref:hypothetical protein n=1 Tax=Streptomyces sp. NBC_00466 TaxID=2903655 RepID=UPI0030E107E9